MNIHHKVDGRVRLSHTELLTDEHVQHIAQLAKVMHDESKPVHMFSADEVIRRGNLTKHDVDRFDTNAWLVYDGYIPIGFSVAHCTAPFYSLEPFASLIYWFVIPEYRHTAAALLLFKGFEKWAKINGAVEIIVGATNDHDALIAEKINRLFERRGYRPVGQWLTKRTVEK